METRRLNRRDFLRLSAAAATGAVMASCSPATPMVIEKEVIREVPVEKAVVVEKEVVKEVEVEKVVQQTVVVEKEVVKAPPPAEQVKLRHQTREPEMAEAEKLLWDELYPRFQEQNPHIEVEYIPMPPDFSEKIIAAAVAGSAPDTFGHC
jgi:ABC-type glycerol-3-phosphate transport system substrate-binding protein